MEIHEKLLHLPLFPPDLQDEGQPPQLQQPMTQADLCDYPFAIAYMDELVARPKTAPDVLLAVQHPPTVTLGRRGGAEHIAQKDLQVHEVARGGSVTWHAPGQLVIYPIVQLNQQVGPWGKGPLGDLPAFVRLLEQCIAATCRHFGVPALQKIGHSGVWLNETRKIASIGLGLRNGWTFHGLALNVNPDVQQFALTPCGLAGVTMTSLHEVCTEMQLPKPDIADVERDLLERLGKVLRRKV